MKTCLFFSEVATGRAGNGLHPFEGQFGDDAPDPSRYAAFFRMVLNPWHSICHVLSNPAVDSVNDELSRACLFDTSPGGVDSFAPSRKGLGRRAFLLYGPNSAGTINMNRFRHDIFIVRVVEHRESASAATFSPMVN